MKKTLRWNWWCSTWLYTIWSRFQECSDCRAAMHSWSVWVGQAKHPLAGWLHSHPGSSYSHWLWPETTAWMRCLKTWKSCKKTVWCDLRCSCSTTLMWCKKASWRWSTRWSPTPWCLGYRAMVTRMISCVPSRMTWSGTAYRTLRSGIIN